MQGSAHVQGYLPAAWAREPVDCTIFPMTGIPG